MKTRLFLLLPFVFVHGAFGAETASATAVFVNPNAPEHVEIRDIGEKAINRVAMTLVNEVNAAVAKNGADKAIDFCHLKALPMTGQIITGMPRITAVKRTSLRLRNPANAPDAHEKVALARVEHDIEDGNPPRLLMQRIDRPGKKPEWRLYRPMAVAPQCLTCHGPSESLSPELRARLAERYPDDKALNYTAGQWRGLIRVSISDTPPSPAAPAPKAATKS
ncbi:MAG: DUF3365 domain-containing protein [Opitutaceae bacterium]|nr:DUF3365 domain-containing protein [Opitutaceae bacterium]